MSKEPLTFLRNHHERFGQWITFGEALIDNSDSILGTVIPAALEA